MIISMFLMLKNFFWIGIFLLSFVNGFAFSSLRTCLHSIVMSSFGRFLLAPALIFSQAPLVHASKIITESNGNQLKILQNSTVKTGPNDEINCLGKLEHLRVPYFEASGEKRWDLYSQLAYPSPADAGTLTLEAILLTYYTPQGPIALTAKTAQLYSDGHIDASGGHIDAHTFCLTGTHIRWNKNTVIVNGKAKLFLKTPSKLLFSKSP